MCPGGLLGSLRPDLAALLRCNYGSFSQFMNQNQEHTQSDPKLEPSEACSVCFNAWRTRPERLRQQNTHFVPSQTELNGKCTSCQQPWKSILVIIKGVHVAQVRPPPATELRSGVRVFDLCTFEKRGKCHGNCTFAHSTLEKAYWEGTLGREPPIDHVEAVPDLLTQSTSSGQFDSSAVVDSTLRICLEKHPDGLALTDFRDNLNRDLGLTRTVKLLTLKSYLLSCTDICIAERTCEKGATCDWVTFTEPVDVLIIEETDESNKKTVHDVPSLKLSEHWLLDPQAVAPEGYEQLQAAAFEETSEVYRQDAITGVYEVSQDTSQQNNESVETERTIETLCMLRNENALLEMKLKNLEEQAQFKIQALEAQVLELQEKEEASLCQICMEHPHDVLILPCMHFLFCAACIAATNAEDKVCPYCRGNILGTLECKQNM